MKKILVIQNNSGDLHDIDLLLPKEEFEIYYSQNLKDGLEIAIRYLPNLIVFYLDKEGNGIKILTKISNDERTNLIPLIVVSMKYAVEEQRKVMELGVDDYIPVELVGSSLVNAINKRIEKLSKLKAAINNRLNSFEEESLKPKRDDHILVKIGNKLKLIKFTDIVCVTALKEYSKLTTKDNCKIVVRKSLKNWLAVLPSNSFLQIHRATIINLEYVDKIVRANERTYTVFLKHITESFDFSHRYANIMRHTFPS
ncbi:MAG: response regulator transcription factor [Melioribacteraceae bacterium]